MTGFNQSDRCVDFTCPERSLSPVVYILLYVCSAAVILLTVCGNMLIIISVFHFKQLHTPSNMAVLSLAVSDFLIGALLMPTLLIWMIESCWIFGRVVCISFWLVDGFLIIVSIYNIALIAMDRYLALSNPFLYTNTLSWRIMCVVISCNWCVSLSYNILFYFFSGSFTSSVICPGECYIFLTGVWAVIDLVLLFIFPLSVIIILYTQVFVIAKKHATAIRELNNHTRPKTQKITSQSVTSERKAAKALGILVAVFLICLLPYFIYSLLGNLVELQAETISKLITVLCFNSTINPFIYALFHPWFRRCIKLIINLRIFQTDSALLNVLY